MRTDGGKGTYEWWYFDAYLNDGSKLVITFRAIASNFSRDTQRASIIPELRWDSLDLCGKRAEASAIFISAKATISPTHLGAWPVWSDDLDRQIMVYSANLSNEGYSDKTEKGEALGGEI